MKFGIIKERKNPPDRRVVFSPDELAKLKQLYQELLLKWKVPIFEFLLMNNTKAWELKLRMILAIVMSLFGVKEVPVEEFDS